MRHGPKPGRRTRGTRGDAANRTERHAKRRTRSLLLRYNHLVLFGGPGGAAARSSLRGRARGPRPTFFLAESQSDRRRHEDGGGDERRRAGRDAASASRARDRGARPRALRHRPERRGQGAHAAGHRQRRRPGRDHSCHPGDLAHPRRRARAFRIVPARSEQPGSGARRCGRPRTTGARSTKQFPSRSTLPTRVAGKARWSTRGASTAPSKSTVNARSSRTPTSRRPAPCSSGDRNLAPGKARRRPRPGPLRAKG